MKHRVFFLWLVVCLLFPAAGWADGKFYALSRMAPENPDQRAVLFFNGTEELLVLQTKFSGRTEEFGWVLPLPQPPELAGLEEAETQSMFLELAWGSRPKTIPVGLYFGWVVFGAVALFGIVLTLKGKGAAPGCLVLGCLVLIFVAIPQFGAQQNRIRILTEKQVGVFDVKVIRGEDGRAVVDWLQENNYSFDHKDEAAFDDYVKRGWCFVTARIAKGERGRRAVSREGLIAPLVARFAATAPVYPLALTATAGRPLHLVLYAFAESSLEAGDLLKTTYAGWDHGNAEKKTLSRLDTIYRAQEGLQSEVDLITAFAPCEFLTRFETVLTPAQMKEDLVLKKAADDSPFRERKSGGFFEGAALGLLSVLLLLFILGHLAGLKARERKKRKQDQPPTRQQT
ncbi:MAG: DUF2330 domain-containing protein [Thermodesulfobacteriota bacterium]